MNTVHRAIARTRSRILLDAWLRNLGWLALAWVGAVAVVLLIERLFALTIPVEQFWVYVALGGAAFVLAPVLAWVHRPCESTAATLMDERLGLKDSLGTSLYVETLHSDDPFAKQVRDDADRLASRTRVNEAFPIRLGKGWGYALPAAAVWALAFAMLPVMDLAGHGEQQALNERREAQTEEVQRQILEANALLKEVETNESELVEADPDDVFKELASLTKRDLTNPDFRKEAITKLASIQDKLAANEQAKKKQLQTAKNNMSRLDPGQRGPADRFADALRRGDFEEAQKELKRLADSIEGMSDAEKEALKNQMQNMANQLEKMAEDQAEAQKQAEENIEKQLKDAGVSQSQINQLKQNGYNQQQVQNAVQNALQNQGVSQQQAQQQAQQTAQQIQQQQQAAQGASQSQSQCQGLGSSFGSMAQSLGAQGQGQQGQQGQPQQGGQPNQFSQGAWQGQQQLGQMQQMQQQLNQMQNAQQQLQNAMSQCQGMGQGQGQGQGGGQGQQQGQGMGQQQANGGGVGPGIGSGSGGNPLGAERMTGPYTTTTEQDIQQGQGRVIASWQSDGELAAGEATVEFDKAITDARNDAEHAVTEDRVPKRYHNAVKDYFQQLPESPDEVRRAPAAPRG